MPATASFTTSARRGFDTDLAIVGAGFAGSLMAMVARQLGFSVVLLERGRHPRFAIGESSTPLANLLLDELAGAYDLPELRPLTKWGTWQQTYPQIACGLKRGFSFFHHDEGRPWRPSPERARELLVAASPQDTIADTHWYRPDLDQFLATQAVRRGVELRENVVLESLREDDEGVVLSGRGSGDDLRLRARFVIDATGPNGFIQRALQIPSRPWNSLPATQALFNHFHHVRRWDDLHPPTGTPPYPVDDAAVHHVFPGGWIWILRFNNGVTSAGVAAGPSLAASLELTGGAAAWARLMERLPAVGEQFAHATAAGPFRHSPQLSFRTEAAVGARWAMLPSAAGFVDPLLSTGFPLALLGVKRLAGILAAGLDHPSLNAALTRYEAATLAELDVTADLVGALYANLDRFEIFRSLTLIYFAAASFSETARRLGEPGRAPGFLLRGHPDFSQSLRECVAAAHRRDTTGPEMARRVEKSIEPFNVAGLGDPARGHWYPALADDLIIAAPKLGADREAIDRLLARCGFTPPPADPACATAIR